LVFLYLIFFIDTQYPVVKKVVRGMLGMKVIRDVGN